MIALWLSLAFAQDIVAADAPVDAAVEGPERSSPPAVIPAEWLDLAEPTRYELGPGQVAWYVRIPGVRKVDVRVNLYRGTYELDKWPTQLANGVGEYADIATVAHDSEQLEITQDLNDVSAYTWISYHAGGAGMTVPVEDLEIGLGLMGEMLHTPTFPKKEIAQRLRDTRLFFTVEAPNSLGTVAWLAMNNAWNPADHPYGARPDLKDLKKLDSGALLTKQLTWRTSGPVEALVVGDVDWATVEPLLKGALSGLGAAGERAVELDLPAPTTTRVVAVDMPGQAQTALRVRYPAPSRTDADRMPYYVMNWALGGHFLSRLNANLREDKGFTYGTGSSWSPSEKRGSTTISVDVKAENTAAAVVEIERELSRLVADGVTHQELDMARQNVIADWNGTRETAASAAGFYAGGVRDQETVAQSLARKQSIDAVTSEGVAEVAGRWLGESPHTWVVVGDRKAIEAQLHELGWEPEWVTAEQAVMGTF